MDKKKWGDGPWMNEPDELAFKYKGYPCLIQRQGMGHLCGYVDIHLFHPFYTHHLETLDLYVHGGISYDRKINEYRRIGFDTAHYDDYLPNSATTFNSESSTYKTIDYVKKGLMQLVDQLHEPLQLP
jgi:hypothetical protein